jgi:hypothetical protein
MLFAQKSDIDDLEAKGDVDALIAAVGNANSAITRQAAVICFG